MAPSPSKPVALGSSAAVRARTIRAIIAQLTAMYLRNRTAISRAVTVTMVVGLANQIRRFIARQRAASARADAERAKKPGSSAAGGSGGDGNKEERIGLNREFIRSLMRLLRIIMPGWRTKEMWLLIRHTFFLVARTLISLQVAALDGAIVKAMVKGNGREFLMRLFGWLLLSVPATYTNSRLVWHQSALAMRYRTRLTEHVHDKYLSNLTFYTISALDDRIQNPEQLIATDVAKFSESLADLYSNLAKPIFDLTIYTFSLTRSVGGDGVLLMAFLVQLSAAVLQAVTPPFGKFVAAEQRLEGDFRSQHSRLIDHSEEVALYAGHEVEKDTLDKGYFTLIKHVNYLLRRRFYYGIAEDFIFKYFWGALGLLLCSIPSFFKLPGQNAMSMGDRTQSFVTNRRILQSASDAITRIMSSYKQVVELAGFTSRVSSLLDVLDEVHAGYFKKRHVSDNADILKRRGVAIESEDIQFTDVPIISPNGDILVPALSFSLKQGDHLLVVGPNGCGKSSMFRILGGLWPVYGGTVRKPPARDIFYIPQRPYLSKGNFRQQIIYPDTQQAMQQRRRVTDADLLAILRVLELDDLVGSLAEGLDTVAEWRDTLSAGVQQRIAMARLFYHRPRYAILDECTSSVPLDVEKVMYDRAKALGITLMTVSHRRSLWKYHTHILQFDGQGKYVFTRLDAERRLKLEEEKEELEAMLRSVPEIERRVRELSVE